MDCRNRQTMTASPAKPGGLPISLEHLHREDDELDITSWLRNLGLERYEQAFRENEIDPEILPKLNADDLKDIGVTAVGHRRKLLDAITALDQNASVLRTKRRSRDDNAPRADAAQAERRQLTIMFVDLVGSTELSTRLDPEDASAVMRAYQNAVAGEITRVEGHIAKYLGDGVLAYFGYPRAHEDEAERAVRAALALTHAVGELKTAADESLAARVGIATGLVVVGELIGEGSSEEQTVVGETPNLAARLQALAEPGAVVISLSTQRLVDGLFEFADLGAHNLKGFAEPITAFTVEGERVLASRFEARSAAAMLPMVGRDQELALLLDRWSLAKEGEGQGILLVGEAGIGKSRIIRAFLDSLDGEPYTRIRYQCSPYHSESALWPVIQQLNHAAQIAASDANDTRLDKLEVLLNRAGGHEAAPLIADLMGLAGKGRYGELDVSPQVKRARTLDALIAQLLALAADQPVLMVMEDAHWIDPTTLELIQQCLDRIAVESVLILLTSRPDRQPQLMTHPHITRLTLNRLARAGAEAIVARLAGDRLPDETIGTIVARTDGVPLFVEELTKAVLETPSETTIPVSLHDTLMTRLDRISQVKEIAQTAACIGREFSYELLAAVANQPTSQLDSCLDQLIVSELIFRRGTPPVATYSFKHALVQEAAYQSLLKSKRQQVHAEIAHCLEDALDQATSVQPEVLAHHHNSAGQIQQAIHYWYEAGRRAAERSANSEAIVHLTNALAALKGMPSSTNVKRQELRLLMAIGPPQIAAQSFASPDVEATYSRAQEICRELGEKEFLLGILQALRIVSMVRLDLASSLEHATELLSLAENSGHIEGRAEGHRAVAITLTWMGRFMDARRHFGDAIDLYSQSSQVRMSERPDGDPSLVARPYAGLVCWVLGYPAQAASMQSEALKLAEAADHPFSLAQTIGITILKNVLARESSLALEFGRTLKSLCQRYGFPHWLAVADFAIGWAQAELQGVTNGMDDMQRGIALATNTGESILRLWCNVRIVDVCIRQGETDLAMEFAGFVAADVKAAGVDFHTAEITRLQAELLMLQGAEPPVRAESLLDEAMATARHQGAKSLELRAATSFARLQARQGKREAARDTLAPIYDWFTEGFDAPDLIDAKLLVDQSGWPAG